MTARLIALEGIRRAGKTTLARSLSAELRGRGLTVVETKEPGGAPESAVGAAIRTLLLDRRYALEPLAETFGFELDRAQTYATLVAPAFARGKWVVSDRHHFGTIAYQHFGRGVPLELIDRLSEAAIGGRYPDRILVLDLPVSVARARRLNPQGDRFDDLDDAFEERVRQGYLFAAARLADRSLVIDATQPEADVLAAARAAVETLITERP